MVDMMMMMIILGELQSLRPLGYLWCHFNSYFPGLPVLAGCCLDSQSPVIFIGRVFLL